MAQDLTRLLAYCGRNMGVDGPTVTELGLLAGCSMLKEPQLRALLAKVGRTRIAVLSRLGAGL